MKIATRLITFCTFLSLCLCGSVVKTNAQETPPEPGKPKSITVPAVKENKLPNGLTVAVVERKDVPLVTVRLLVKSGAANESDNKAGLANLTAAMLTKGTKSRTATQIAEQIEFLGGSIDTGAGWNNSNVAVTVTSDKLDEAMAILADVVLNPAFKQEELDLLKTQTLDGLTYNLKQPGFLANYVASKYSFGEHPAGGTPASINSIAVPDVAAFHSSYFSPANSVLIFAGDITAARAEETAKKVFGNWKNVSAPAANKSAANGSRPSSSAAALPQRLLVIDLPNSGQALVSYQKDINDVGRSSTQYYPSSVLNSLLGGGYSSRLNQEIRIKRGLSYGAGSSFSWRAGETNFGARAQTKNESAAQVAELVLAEVKRLSGDSIADTELTPRKSVLTGGFSRNLETTAGIAAAVSDLYSFGIPAGELNKYMPSVNAVTDAQIRDFAKANLMGGDIIIVGDYAVFKDDLAKRFPNMQVDVVKADELDITQENLRKKS